MEHDAFSTKVGRVGMVARWKPVHLGHAAVLGALVSHADHAVIGIGSSNRYDARNPFTAEESADMIRLVLGPHAHFSVVEVPDLGHGPTWRQMVIDLLGPLDLFVTANPYVRSLLCDTWPVVHPARLLASTPRMAVDGTMVREAMLHGDSWEDLVPADVATYLRSRGLVERFAREFGDQAP